MKLNFFSSYPPSECSCFDQFATEHGERTPVLHREVQDTSCRGWRRLLDRVEHAVETGQEEFEPLAGLSGRQRRDVVTLPASIARLVNVRKLGLYGTHLVRIPPEIGEMRSLADLDVYTSRCLHFFPYEITRCTNLRGSRVSTRALYGNYKHRPPFPDLTHGDNTMALSLLAPSSCSVCRAPLDPHRVVVRWITLAAGTDYVPMLVNACSVACIDALPPSPAGYVQHPHTGGAGLVQPPRY